MLANLWSLVAVPAKIAMLLLVVRPMKAPRQAVASAAEAIDIDGQGV